MKNTVYQLNTVTGSQMNSYIITTADGKVIVIDGGYRQDAENMLAYLRELTGETLPHVDAWILTHAHRDHITCFVEVVEKHWDKLTVGKVMYHFPSVQYCAREGQWGGYDRAIEEFNAILPAIADRIEILYGFDTYDIGDAHIEVLYSPNCEIQCNYINNSSVIFMLTLGGKKVLFTGDAGIEEGDKCLALYAGTDKLKADYVQMAHHGQNGVEKRFYEAVAPTGCLWGTPKWLWDNDAGGGYNTHVFKTIEVRGWMDDLGVKEHYVLMNGTQVVEL